MTFSDPRFPIRDLPQPVLCKLNGLLPGGNLTHGLRFAYRFKELAEDAPWFETQFRDQIVPVQQARRWNDLLAFFHVVFKEDPGNVQRRRPVILRQGVVVRSAQVGEPEQDQVGTRLTGIAEKAVDGFARGRLSFVQPQAGEKMETHMVENNLPDAPDLIIAQVERVPAGRGYLSPLHIVVEKADAPCLIHRPRCRLLDIVIQRGEE
jgi:hypothetical protein